MNRLPAFVAADIHLSDNHPQRTKLFLDFLARAKTAAAAVYLLGDTFDIWSGDDDSSDVAAVAKSALANLSATGAAVFIQRGNRDFLLGKKFMRETGGKLIGEEHCLQCGQQRFLLMHGDSLSDDAVYRAYRFCIRKAAMPGAIMPTATRKKIAAALRKTSARHRRPAQISLSRATLLLQKHNCQTLIHGHTHRAGREQWQKNGATFNRHCLPDWENGGGYLQINPTNGDLRAIGYDAFSSPAE